MWFDYDCTARWVYGILASYSLILVFKVFLWSLGSPSESLLSLQSAIMTGTKNLSTEAS